MSLSDDSGPRPCAWTARSWLANKHGGHFGAVRSSSFDLPLYDQAEIDRLSARIAELHECLTKCAESAYEAGVADERERWAGEVAAWRERFPGYTYRPQDDCVALKA